MAVRSTPSSAISFVADRIGGTRIALGALLDHALEQAGREGDAAGLDGLEIDGRQQEGLRLVAPGLLAIVDDGGDGTQIAPLGRGGGERLGGFGLVEQQSAERKLVRDIDGLALADRDHRRPHPRQPDPAQQRRPGGVARQDIQFLRHSVIPF